MSKKEKYILVTAAVLLGALVALTIKPGKKVSNPEIIIKTETSTIVQDFLELVIANKSTDAKEKLVEKQRNLGSFDNMSDILEILMLTNVPNEVIETETLASNSKKSTVQAKIRINQSYAEREFYLENVGGAWQIARITAESPWLVFEKGNVVVKHPNSWLAGSYSEQYTDIYLWEITSEDSGTQMLFVLGKRELPEDFVGSLECTGSEKCENVIINDFEYLKREREVEGGTELTMYSEKKNLIVFAIIEKEKAQTANMILETIEIK